MLVNNSDPPERLYGCSRKQSAARTVFKDSSQWLCSLILIFGCGPARDCEECTFERDELRVRISVLLETIETLQAGEPGEREQRIVSLTAQLTASNSKQAILQSRVNKLHVGIQNEINHTSS